MDDNNYSPPPHFDEKAFYLEVSLTLASCQLLEERLKQYITDAFDLVRKLVDARMIFKFSIEQYADSSLGRLLGAFGMLCDNKTLIADLWKFKKERDVLSHRGISDCLDPMQELDWGLALDFQRDLPVVREEGDRLRTAVHEEARKFLGHLYFDPVPPPRNVPPTDVPLEWLSFCEMDAFSKVVEFYFYAETDSVQVVPIAEIDPPVRDAGAPELDKFRLVAILCAFKAAEDGQRRSLPPCKASALPAGSAYRFKLVDGYHRYYASKLAGFTQLPIVLVDAA